MMIEEQVFEVSIERAGAYRSISEALEAADQLYPDAEPFVPAMACGVEPMVRQGIIAQNVAVLDLQNVSIEG